MLNKSDFFKNQKSNKSNIENIRFSKNKNKNFIYIDFKSRRYIIESNNQKKVYIDKRKKNKEQ